MIEMRRGFVVSAVFAVLMASASAQTTGTAQDKNMGWELRKMILSKNPAGKSVIMDVNVNGSVVSVMSSTEGDASIYLSSGGGMIGGGAHADIRASAIAFATEAVKRKPEMQATNDFPYPEDGKVRFYLRTGDGLFFAEAPLSELSAGKHPLSHAYSLGQEVFTRFKAFNSRIEKR